MIKSKLDARERALELAVKTFETSDSFSSNLFMDWVKMFEQYIVGDAELPETQSDTELVKAFLEVMNSELDKKCKPMPDYSEMLKAIQTGNGGTSAELPCRPETE